MIYNQHDAPWSGTEMGTSPFTMGAFGCLTTDHAQALLLAGYTLTPLDVVTKFNEIGAYTDASYPAGPGLLIWGKVAEAFTQYHSHLDSTGAFKFAQVIASYPSGRFEHWVLEHNGIIYDPFDGTEGMKANYRPTGFVRSADIDQAPTPPDDLPTPTMFPEQRTVEVVGTGGAGLNCRVTPSSALPALQLLPEGSSYFVTGFVHGEIVDHGLPTENDKWYLTAGGHYIAARYTSIPNP